MNILWIEDFGGSITNPSTDTLNAMFGDMLNHCFDDWEENKLKLLTEPFNLENLIKESSPLHCVFLRRHYFDYIDFKDKNDLIENIDIVIIDINLTKGIDYNFDICLNNNVDNSSIIISDIEEKQKFHKEAGFYIFNDLVHLGIPSNKICFMTGEEVSFKNFEKKCKEIYMPKVTAFEKSDADYKNLRNWIKKQESDYCKLRRGIIDACNTLESFVSDIELKEYFFGLKRYLSLKEPDKTEKDSIYLHLARAILHDWDNHGHAIPTGKPNKSLGWLLRTARNWLTHDSLLTNIDEKMISFLFLVNARLLNLNNSKLEDFEKILLSIFTITTASEDEKICQLKYFYTDTLNIGKSNGLDFMKKQYFYSAMVNDFHENEVKQFNGTTLDYKKFLFRIFMFSVYDLNNDPKESQLDYRIKLSKRNKLPNHLTEFEKYFYDFAI